MNGTVATRRKLVNPRSTPVLACMNGCSVFPTCVQIEDAYMRARGWEGGVQK